ncbi:trypsin-like serine protease [Siccirubricoccus sp. KC 17139]|uniref:Trypsin-like serine protease n=1 Tax=Siccirubricoccus soli TaxID=2899147 RepID=A0ABT1CYE8_9PROT|nr:trypsin-like serine protease [Siccirubricoccus soli]MCO6414681.1 trypsin-like serine protease [Siccirubricoccus soli]MCP2680811.1 trypsin-like serine protease [Siccirubricoccus soli]
MAGLPGATARRPVRRLLLPLLLLLLALPAAAQEGLPHPLLPGVGPQDPRQPVDVAARPWRGLGRVQRETGGFCTGALVGAREVLTAAHCLVSPRSRQLLRPSSMHFLLGYERGAYVAHARVAAFRVAPGFSPQNSGPASLDWAVLVLEAPLGPADRILPLMRELPPPRTPLMLGGYQQDRPEVLLADAACRAIGRVSQPGGGALLLHDCAGTRGVSGAPVLAQGPDGAWQVAGIASRVGMQVALGAAVPAASVAAEER